MKYHLFVDNSQVYVSSLDPSPNLKFLINHLLNMTLQMSEMGISNVTHPKTNSRLPDQKKNGDTTLPVTQGKNLSHHWLPSFPHAHYLINLSANPLCAIQIYIHNSFISHHFHHYPLGPSHHLLSPGLWITISLLVTLLPCLPLLGLFSKSARKILLKYKSDHFTPLFKIFQ